MRPAEGGEATRRGARRWRGLVALPLVALVLAGCATATDDGAPTQPPTGSPTPSATASAPAVALRLSGSELAAVDAGGATVVAASFDGGPDAAVDLISHTTGSEPTVTAETEGCAGPLTSYEWDGAVVTAWTGSDGFVVAFSVPELGGVRLESSGGFAVGDDITAFASTAPAEDVGHPNETDTFVAFDVVSRTSTGDYASPVGAVGYATGGVLSSLIAPGEWSSFYC